MTTEEFIEKVNGLSEDECEGMSAEFDDDDNVFITKTEILGTVTYASLSSGSRKWHFRFDSDVPSCVLKLMGELASDEYRGKFLLLNGEPEDGFCSFFIIGDDGQLYPHGESNLDELVKFACTKEKLDELKDGFSQRMQEAIDTLAVPLSKVASKMEED